MEGQPATVERLGPKSVLKDVIFDIVVNDKEKTRISKSFTLPTGRIAKLPSGLPMYTAILDTTRVQLPDGRAFDATPSITIIDTPDVGQDVLVSVAYGGRTWGLGIRDNFKTEVTIRVGDQTFIQTQSLYVSCMDGSTPIALYDGSTVPISAIVRREFVRNPITGAAMEVALSIRGPEPFPMYRIGIDDEAVLFSSEHPIPILSGVKVAREIVRAIWLWTLGAGFDL